ncbi:MAG: Ldh family oxidoreductase [Fibrobacteres bacterium]|nr:Ldh family oxidoreductase [Fibrobacterota bacterium]
MKRIPISKLTAFGTELLVKKGFPRNEAAYLSKFIIETEAFRSTSHGLDQLFALVGNIGSRIIPGKAPKVTKNKGAMTLIDGEGVAGLLCMKIATEKAAEKAMKLGVSFTSVINTTWVGSLGSHLKKISEKGLIAMAWAQTSACKDCAPFGGITPCFSTNPIAMSFPVGKEAMIADYSTASYSMASVSRMISNGEKSATPRFVDKEGNPTTEPSVLKDGGSIMFTGLDLEGHKFYGLSLFIEALTAMSGGSANNPNVPSRQSAMLMVANPEMFAGNSYFKKEINRFVAHVKSSKVRPGFDSIKLPGERGFASLKEARKDGVPLNNTKLEKLEALAKENNIAIKW